MTLINSHLSDTADIANVVDIQIQVGFNVACQVLWYYSFSGILCIVLDLICKAKISCQQYVILQILWNSVHCIGICLQSSVVIKHFGSFKTLLILQLFFLEWNSAH